MGYAQKWIKLKFVPVLSQLSVDWSRFSSRIALYLPIPQLWAFSQALLMKRIPATWYYRQHASLWEWYSHDDEQSWVLAKQSTLCQGQKVQFGSHQIREHFPRLLNFQHGISYTPPPPLSSNGFPFSPPLWHVQTMVFLWTLLKNSKNIT